mmetsp:Transcript_18627/g.56242  ORF Transcript_18627/g.56242 Transcript_18627/m.56242 type:complete len:201 (+) Transcript_18627:1120-1722(+)
MTTAAMKAWVSAALATRRCQSACRFGDARTCESTATSGRARRAASRASRRASRAPPAVAAGALSGGCSVGDCAGVPASGMGESSCLTPAASSCFRGAASCCFRAAASSCFAAGASSCCCAAAAASCLTGVDGSSSEGRGAAPVGWGGSVPSRVACGLASGSGVGSGISRRMRCSRCLSGFSRSPLLLSHCMRPSRAAALG